MYPGLETMPHARLILVALPIHFLVAKIDDEVTNLFLPYQRESRVANTTIR